MYSALPTVARQGRALGLSVQAPVDQSGNPTQTSLDREVEPHAQRQHKVLLSVQKISPGVGSSRAGCFEGNLGFSSADPQQLRSSPLSPNALSV